MTLDEPVPQTQVFQSLKSLLLWRQCCWLHMWMVLLICWKVLKKANCFCLKGLDYEFIMIMFNGYLLITFHCNLNTLVWNNSGFWQKKQKQKTIKKCNVQCMFFWNCYTDILLHSGLLLPFSWWNLSTDNLFTTGKM